MQDMDPYEFAEPADVLKQLPKGWVEAVQAAKWQVRVCNPAVLAVPTAADAVQAAQAAACAQCASFLPHHECVCCLLSHHHLPQERRGALQALKAAAGAPRLQPGDFGEVLSELKKVLTKDANVVCVTETVACLGPPLPRHT